AFLAADVTLRLKPTTELALADGQPQPLLELHFGRNLLAHAGVEVDGASLEVALRPIHRMVGVAPQLVEARPVLGKGADPERSRGEHLEGFDMERLLELLQEAIDHRSKLRLVVQRI